MRKLLLLLVFPLLLASGVTADAATGTVHFLGGSHPDLKNPTTGQCIDVSNPIPGPRAVENHTDTKLTIYLNPTCTSDDTARVVPPGGTYSVSGTWWPIIYIRSIKLG
jgi:hypothetical protein